MGRQNRPIKDLATALGCRPCTLVDVLRGLIIMGKYSSIYPDYYMTPYYRRYGEQLRDVEDWLGRQATYEEVRAVLEPGPVTSANFQHARSSRTAILREEEAGFHVRLHKDGSITWEGHVARPDGTVEES